MVKQGITGDKITPTIQNCLSIFLRNQFFELGVAHSKRLITYIKAIRDI